jgi:hypothetical protein
MWTFTIQLGAILKVTRRRRGTIPVSTKPDLIDAGAEGDVLDLLLGKKVAFSLRIPYDQGGRGRQRWIAEPIHGKLAERVKFFEQQEPWKSVDRSMFGAIYDKSWVICTDACVP